MLYQHLKAGVFTGTDSLQSVQLVFTSPSASLRAGVVA
jgi:hypothetical protein